MNDVVRVAAAVAVAALAGAFAGPGSEAAGPFDGTYRGTTKLISARMQSGGGGSPCSGTSDGRPSSRRVVDNKIKMTWGTGTEYEISVAADGVVSGDANAAFGQITNTGKITGNSMVIDYGSRFCSYRFEGKKGG